jgi:hypothetical protein
MTRLPAKVLSSEKRGDRYCLAKIELSNFRRSFNSLRFGGLFRVRDSAPALRGRALYEEIDGKTSDFFGFRSRGFRIGQKAQPAAHAEGVRSWRTLNKQP